MTRFHLILRFLAWSKRNIILKAAIHYAIYYIDLSDRTEPQVQYLNRTEFSNSYAKSEGIGQCSKGGIKGALHFVIYNIGFFKTHQRYYTVRLDGKFFL